MTVKIKDFEQKAVPDLLTEAGPEDGLMRSRGA